MILIDMDMPKSCSECPLYDDHWDYPACYATDETRGYNFKYREKRMPNCPLREFSKKGRVIKPKSLGFTTIGNIKAPKMPLGQTRG